MKKREDLCGWRTWLMNTPLEVWMLQDKCAMPPLERTKALKMRLGRGEDKFSLHSITNLGEFWYYKFQFWIMKDPSPPFIGARAGHEA